MRKTPAKIAYMCLSHDWAFGRRGATFQRALNRKLGFIGSDPHYEIFEKHYCIEVGGARLNNAHKSFTLR